MSSDSFGTSTNFLSSTRSSGKEFKTLPAPCAKPHLLLCVLNLVTWKKKKKKEQLWGWFQIILAWKSGINSNVSTLWSKEAPRKSSFWSTSQNWSWDLQNQFELNEFARTALDTVRDTVAAGGWASGQCCALVAALRGNPPGLETCRSPAGPAGEEAKCCRPESLKRMEHPCE